MIRRTLKTIKTDLIDLSLLSKVSVAASLMIVASSPVWAHHEEDECSRLYWKATEYVYQLDSTADTLLKADKLPKPIKEIFSAEVYKVVSLQLKMLEQTNRALKTCSNE